ncbi:hypothetical protein AJ80_00414 [Polytolypa hystricis UAMH7299]|uniref:ABC transporter n=1 Tax=Polytolypa hystricis (strain UAMH7299) TaxID=1447883 RepID=A0A2B7YUW4_POLH7|nr:hypothetical protein AJ80_00414 [Polytolypa hystricis UAMH7299]
MDGRSLQTAILDPNEPLAVLGQNNILLSCRPIWDSDNARFSPCAVPYITSLPAILITLITVYYLLDYFLPQWQPKWARPFVLEHASKIPGELPLEEEGEEEEEKNPSLHWVIALLIPTAVGCAADCSHLISSSSLLIDAIQPVTWIIVVILIVVKRPKTCPLLLLSYFVTVAVVKLLLATRDERASKPVLQTAADYISLVAAGAACCTIFHMPFREPSSVSPDISAVGQQPDCAFRSPEDSLRLWQFLTVSWMAPLISTGKRRQLNEPDVWFLPFEFQHKGLDERFGQLKGSVLGRLLQANGIDILIIALIGIVQLICSFSTPVLLQKLLQVTKDSTIPKRIPLTYALLTLIMRLIAVQSQVLNIWYGRRCYERSRGEMILMVHEKALSRKNVFGQNFTSQISESASEIDGLLNEEREESQGGQPSRNEKTRFYWWSLPWNQRTSKKADVKTKEATSMGKMLNLIRGDVYEVSQRFWEIDALVDKPLGLIIAVVFVWNLFGPSCLLGIAAVLAAQLLSALITSILLRQERKRRTATDTRLQITSQFVEAIRHLRWYGWQNHWLNQVKDARKQELRRRIITSVLTILIRVVNASASGLFPVVVLYSYTVLAGRPLSIEVIFPALQLFTMLETRLRDITNLITVFINASVAMSRIEDFMSEPDKVTEGAAVSFVATASAPIQFESCSYAWPGTLAPVLTDINLAIPKGLTVVTGKVGAGKTAFLQSLLGELDKLKGTDYIPNEMLGYCAQTPWLQSMSIRDNILFSSAYDERRYKQVLAACALVQDLSSFKHGDLTFIGENGTGLSGGQKARVALARAVYSTAKILLLDDPLSALDFNTAEAVVRKCLAGPLMRGRTVILATHRTVLVRDIAQQVIEIGEGRATVYDKDRVSATLREEAVPNDGQKGPSKQNRTETEDEQLLEEASAAVPDKFIEEEYRAEWGVQSRVYWSYIKAGKLRWWAVLIAILTVYRLSVVALAWFLKDWGEMYEKDPTPSFFKLAVNVNQYTSSIVPTGIDAYLPPPFENVRPWLWAFFAITTFQVFNFLMASLVMAVIVYYASKTMFEQVMVRVSHAAFRYFDITPVGRLMNRLTSDIGVVDGNIGQQFQNISFLAITWVTSIVVIASVTPVFLVFSLALTGAFLYIFLQFLPSSQSLRRLEMVSLSPLLSNFGELLHGLTTVRAFHAETRFQNRVIDVVDKFQGMDHFYWSLQSWLMYRFEGLSAVSIFCLTALALYTGVSAGLIAFILIAAENFVTSTHGLCIQYGQLQMDFVAVERVEELLHVEQEPPGSIDPPAAWPRFGSDVVFENVTVRYASHLDPSICNISLRIPGGCSTAIIGRTGSGKSTLALSLLSVVRAESGRITIDNINIADVNTNALRHRVTFVAQEPVLFPGNIRQNLDPAAEYSDAECADVLRRICSSGRHGWTLDTIVEERGRNLSHGQRQLIGLCRAVLRRSAIVILDEATASIDHETSLEIQRVIRQELKESTVVSIAHRLEAIQDADYYVVLDQGRVSEQGFVGENQAIQASARI